MADQAIASATTVITQRHNDPMVGRYERLLDGGTKPTLAKLSLARMVAATVLRMWKDEDVYASRKTPESFAFRGGGVFAPCGVSE